MKINSYFYLLLTLNLVIVFFTFSPLSLTGYWTDVSGTAIIGIITIVSIKKFIGNRRMLLLLLAAAHGLLYFRLLISLILFTSFGKYPLSLPVEKNEQSLFVEHEYFMPTGAYGCGYGTVWRTKSFTFFPFFEYEIYNDDCADRDYENFIKTGKWD